jgi:hypothetical protein
MGIGERHARAARVNRGHPKLDGDRVRGEVVEVGQDEDLWSEG